MFGYSLAVSPCRYHDKGHQCFAICDYKWNRDQRGGMTMDLAELELS